MLKGTVDLLADLFRHGYRYLRVQDAAQHECEFVAANPGQHVVGAHAAPQTLGDAAQDLVPDGVAERVVDVLEPIEVQEQDREPLPELPALAIVCSRRSCNRPRLGSPVSASSATGRR
ncbi:MAG: hypothetical protein MZW92_78675 [Comamonadaceae bacterium]|nr:hypothetical protein [Comamonadaceae bacterium]